MTIMNVTALAPTAVSTSYEFEGHALLAEAIALTRRGLRLEYLTLAWNVVGTGVLLATAVAADSVALISFGLDSMIEVLASLVVVWQLKGISGERDQRAMRVIGGAFALLAVYVALQSVRTLSAGLHPGTSVLGTTWVAATIAAMLLLAVGKHGTATRLGNVVLTTEARVTLIDAYLAAGVLLGLILSAASGWWWADPLAAFMIVGYAVKEARESLRWQPT
jgi:divalent metal cation (Fe/Co/Zn/Cd) transporter